MRTVKCPTCGKPANFDPSNLYRPFCSDRCQVLDLGAWADERFKIPTEQGADAVNQNSDQDADEDADLSQKNRR